MKKTLSLLLSLIMICSIFTISFVPAEAATNAAAKAKLDSICNTSPYRVGVDNYDNCYTYASGVANKMFGCAPGGVSGYTLANPGNFMLVGQTAGTEVTASSLSNLLSKALPGDVVQMYWYHSTNITASTGRSTHTAIVYAADSSSVTFLQDGASWPSIQKTTYNYNSSYVLWKGSGFGISLYRYKNYDSLFKTYTQAPTKPTVSVNKSTALVNENVTISFSAERASYYWIGIYKDNELYTQDNVFSNSYTITYPWSGVYTVFVTAINNCGEKQSSTSFELKPKTTYTQAPSKPIVSVDKSVAMINENVTISFSAERAEYYWVGIYKDNELYTQDNVYSNSYTITYPWTGTYTVYVAAINSCGETTNSTSFELKPNTTYTQAPTYAHVYTDKLNYAVNETVTFNMSSDGNVNTLTVIRPDGTSFYVEGLSSKYTNSFSTPGYYECYIEAWNGIGSFKSQRTSWYVGPPQYSYISINKNEFAIGENVSFTFNTAAKADYNTLIVTYPDGTSKHYQQSGTGKTLSFSSPGQYSARVEAWNDIGSCLSDYVYFTVKCNSHSYTNKVTKQATCTATGTRTYTCSKCGYSYTETIAKLGHDWGTPTYKWSSDNKTCTATRVCSRDSSHTETETVNTTSTVIKQPTATSTGTRKFTATFSNSAFTTQTKNVSIPKLEEDDIYFPDVTKGAWYYDAVQYCAKKGYVSGYANGFFGPADNLKRQDFVMILARIAGANLDSYANKTSKFSDVKKGAYYYSAVMWAVETGVIGGYSNGKFGVGDNITREQVATILYRYVGSPNVSSVDSTLSKFSDVKKISGFAKTPLAWAVQNGVISGMADGRAAPTEGASRAQIAVIITNMDKQGMFKQ